MISYTPDHAERAVAEMLSQDRRKPRLVAAVRARSKATQTKEDLYFDLLLSNNVDDATGDLLDRWGRFVLEPRGGLEDEAYRGFVRARIAANLSGGTIDELLSIFASITAPSVVANVELYPAGFSLTAVRADPLDDDLRARVRVFMHEIKPGGVGMTMIESTTVAFTYDIGPGFDAGELSRIL